MGMALEMTLLAICLFGLIVLGSVLDAKSENWHVRQKLADRLNTDLERGRQRYPAITKLFMALTDLDNNPQKGPFSVFVAIVIYSFIFILIVHIVLGIIQDGIDEVWEIIRDEIDAIISWF
jgi:hypothetical protein